MQEFRQSIEYDSRTLANSIKALPFPGEQVCFFDIETTGLSPQVSSVYLIGAAWSEGNSFHLIQWFADDYTSEKALLESFASFAGAFRAIVHYNGSTFDIPYLEKKYKEHNVPSPFSSMESLDLYREIRRQKVWLSSSDRKLATMEKLLSFRRQDCYTGKDCIDLYTRFMHKKFFRDTQAEVLKKNLLLHNHDDLIGTLICSQFLYYTRYHEKNPGFIRKDNQIQITDYIEGVFPIQWEKESEWWKIHFYGNKIQVDLPLYNGTLYHFYRDYKNYYYLPEEDAAIHKSVGIYVDPSRREKATAANCYTKKTGTFLPLPCRFTEESTPLFRKERKARDSYLYFDPQNPTLDKKTMGQILSHCITK